MVHFTEYLLIIYLGVKAEYKNRNYKISLHPVLEYSLEFPYGRQARVWVTTETACYRIMSMSSNYIAYWQEFYDKVCFAGHVVNILLNYRGPLLLVKLIVKVSKLSGKSPEETYELLKVHRKCIQDMLKEQNLPAKIRKEYNTLQSNQSTWELTWDQHLVNAEKKPGKSKLNIMSFFRPKTSDENSNESLNSVSISSITKNSSNFDETSSLLSLTVSDNPIYIESYDDFEESGIMQEHIGSSFTSARFLEWKLPENDSLNGSFYNCPVCKVTFRTEEVESIAAFIIHLKAHRTDCNFKNLDAKDEEYSVNDFESRFNYFRNDLKELITDSKFSYTMIPLVFDRNIPGFEAKCIDRPFKECSLFEIENADAEQPPSLVSSASLNPIKALKFNPNAISSISSTPVKPVVSNLVGPPPVPTASVSSVPLKTPTQTTATAATTVPAPPKKPRARKPPVPKTPTTPMASAAAPVAGTFVQAPTLNSFPFQGPANPQLAQVPVKANVAITVPPPPAVQAQPILTKQPPTVQSQVPTSASAPGPTVQSVSSTVSPVIPLNSDKNNNLIVIDPEDEKSNATTSPGVKRPFSSVPVPIELSEYSAADLPIPTIVDMSPSHCSDGKQFGCIHYKVNCKFYAECCKRWFPCRFCHDEQSDHKLNRHETRFCLCMFCGNPQKAVGRCTNPKCRLVMAHYFCDKCKFWDNDPNKLIYHCDKCEICRTGLKSNYEHCDKCGKCVAKSVFSSHQCELKTAATKSSDLKILLNVKSSEEQIEKRIKIDTAAMANDLTALRDHKQNVDQSVRRKCWNCSNALSTNSDGSLQSKYCTHCSAIVE